MRGDILAMLATVAVLVALLVSPASSCSVSGEFRFLSTEEVLYKAPLVVYGKDLEHYTLEHPDYMYNKFIRFQVYCVFRTPEHGTTNITEIITVKDRMFPTSCDPTGPREGQEYLLLLKRGSDGYFALNPVIIMHEHSIMATKKTISTAMEICGYQKPQIPVRNSNTTGVRSCPKPRSAPSTCMSFTADGEKVLQDINLENTTDVLTTDGPTEPVTEVSTETRHTSDDTQRYPTTQRVPHTDSVNATDDGLTAPATTSMRPETDTASDGSPTKRVSSPEFQVTTEDEHVYTTEEAKNMTRNPQPTSSPQTTETETGGDVHRITHSVHQTNTDSSTSDLPVSTLTYRKSTRLIPDYLFPSTASDESPTEFPASSAPEYHTGSAIGEKLIIILPLVAVALIIIATLLVHLTCVQPKSYKRLEKPSPKVSISDLSTQQSTYI